MAIPKSHDPRRGMQLDKAEIDALMEAGVRAFPRVQEYRESGTFTLIGDESGGSAHEVGHYVAYVPLAGQPFINVRKSTRLARNSFHRRIVAKSMLRIEIFRYLVNHIHLRVSLHWVNPEAEKTGKGNPFGHHVLFNEQDGMLDEKGNASFMSRDGGPDMEVPAEIRAAFRAALAGSRCRGCKCSTHFNSVNPVILSAKHAEQVYGKKATNTASPKLPVTISKPAQPSAASANSANTPALSKEKTVRPAKRAAAEIAVTATAVAAATGD